jgi:streptomycin 6-kinase
VDFTAPALEATRHRLLARFGQQVDPWWERLPGVIADLAVRWELAVGEAVGRGNTSLVVRCRRADGRPAVLKLTPDAELGGAEAAALRRWEPSGRVPAVWGHDPALGALLLEAIPDATPLAERRTAVELGEIVSLIDDLHQGGPPADADGWERLAERVEFIFELWVERHGRGGEVVSRAVPIDRLRRGQALARELAAVAGEQVLLHGDLHPGNVLDGGAVRGLVAIDPRPCVGDAAVDVVDWVFWAADDPGAWEPRSRDLAVALGLDHQRLWAWCAAFAAMLATAKAARGASPDEVAALLALSP